MDCGRFSLPKKKRYTKNIEIGDSYDPYGLSIHMMDGDQWMYDSIMYEEVEMNVENEEDVGVKVDCSDAFNTYELFGSRDEVLQWARSLAHDIGFVVVNKYMHWHRLKDNNVVRDLFWSHPDAVKLTNSCNLVFLIDSTYKTNRYKLSLLDIVGVTPTGMTFSAGFAYWEGEHLNNVVWALERFRGLLIVAWLSKKQSSYRL
ncbi:hypothetical protein HKD37_06G017309 [Glycine soja]